MVVNWCLCYKLRFRKDKTFTSCQCMYVCVCECIVSEAGAYVERVWVFYVHKHAFNRVRQYKTRCYFIGFFNA